MKHVFHTDFSYVGNVPIAFWILLAVILFSQAIWLFTDAGKRNANKWLWGLWGLIQFPTPLLLYLLIVQKILSKDQRKKRIRTILLVLWFVVSLILITVGIIYNQGK